MDNIVQKQNKYSKNGVILLFSVIAFLITIPIYANNTYILSEQVNQKKVSINIVNRPIREILLEIKRQTEINFILNADISKAIGNVSLTVKNTTVEEALKTLLKNSNYNYEIANNYITIVDKKVEKPKSQNIERRLNGKVIDKNSKLPISGATILLKGSSKGAISDGDGNFTVSVKNGDVLDVTFVGMLAQNLTIEPSMSTIKISLESDALAVDDVIVTGIFTKSKESYTGSSTTITAKEMKKFGNRSVLSQIKNIDPSFNVMENNSFGSDPNKLPDIQMRGSTSLGVDIKDLQSDSKNSSQSNLPLFILDGFEISLQKVMDMDQSMIESITLLKDASATAMYGARGANGIVVLTSQKVEAGKIKITYRGNLNIEGPDFNSYDLLNAQEKLQYEVSAGLYKTDYNGNSLQELILLYSKRKTYVERGIDTYWLKYPVQTGVGHRHSIRIDGGDNNFKYAATVGYNDVKGVMKGSDRSVISGNMYLQYNFGKFSFQNDLSLLVNKSNNSPYGSFSLYPRLNPYLKPYDDDGNLNKILEREYLSTWPDIAVGNPLYNALLPYKDSNKSTNIQNNFAIDWKILPELAVKGRFTIISDNGRTDLYKSAKHTDFEKEEFTGEGYSRRGSYRYGTNYNFDYEGDFTANFNKTIANKHLLYVGLNFNFAQDNSESYNVRAEGFTAINMDFLGMANAYEKLGRPLSSEAGSRRVGFLGNFNYTYDKKYFVDMSGKMEGSSKFGKNSKLAPFWSAGLGWNIHNEKFITNKDVFSSLRIRGSYGITGSQNFNPYQALTTFRYFTEESYRNWLGSSMMAFGNEDLKWQQTRQLNVGLDGLLFKGMVRFNVDYYNKITDNVLSDVNMPLSSGFNSYKANIGKVRNNGIEVTANVYLIRNTKSEITWSVGGSLAHNKNTIMKISNSLEFLNESLNKDAGNSPSYLLKEGQSKNTLYAVKSLGIDPSNGREVFIKKDGTTTYTWDYNDKVACGVDEPSIWGNFNTMFRYKGISFNAVFSYRLGGVMYNQTLINKIENVDPWSNVDRRVLYDRWTKAGDHVFFKSIADRTATKASSRFVQDESTFECRSLNLSYDIDSNWSKQKLGIELISIGIYAEDVFRISTIRQERGLDYPFSRKFSASLSIRF